MEVVVQPGPGEGYEGFTRSFTGLAVVPLQIGFMGTWSHEDVVTLIRFPIPDEIGVVVKATLELYCYAKINSYNSDSAPVYRNDADWTPVEVPWPGPPSTLIANNPLQGLNTVNAWWIWDVTPAVDAWIRGLAPNFGFRVSRIGPVQFWSRSGWRFYPSTHTDPNLRPKLVITHTGKGLLFKDPVTGAYFSDAEGNVLTPFDLGAFRAGDVSSVKAVTLENHTGTTQQVPMVRVSQVASGDEVELSRTLDPFIPEDPLVFPGTFPDGATIGTFYVRAKAPITAQGQRQFVLEATGTPA